MVGLVVVLPQGEWEPWGKKSGSKKTSKNTP